jgi:hypothetical protein
MRGGPILAWGGDNLRAYHQTGDLVSIDLKPAAATVALIAAAGCASGGGSPSPSAASPARADQVATACTATVAGADLSAWREVAADGFTFCVPPDWRGSGRRFTRGQAEVTWGSGERRVESGTVTQTVVATDLASIPLPTAMDRQESAETIEGRLASVWRYQREGSFRVGAKWTTPRLWLSGTASSAPMADTEMTIIRTVRFTAP